MTEICLTASEELKLIDPKINLRVSKKTPLSVCVRGTRLTKQGLGFPQYLNDDVIIPGLVRLGYAPEELLAALEADFAGYEDLRRQLMAYPKMGNNEDSVDAKAALLMEEFIRLLDGVQNNRGGIIRPGTGSALEYVSSARCVGATADGRPAGQPYGANFSPSVTARLNGPLSAIISFTKFDLTGMINGGPFTMERHDTVFRGAEGEKKVAMPVQALIARGGHQVQINSVNRDQLLVHRRIPNAIPISSSVFGAGAAILLSLTWRIRTM